MEHQEQKAKSQAEAWPLPLPLVALRSRDLDINPLFPPGLEDLRDYIKSVADALQVPIESPLFMMLPVLATACSHAVQIEAAAGWVQPPPIWVMLIAESSERKSAVVSELSRSLHAWERSKQASGVDDPFRVVLDDATVEAIGLFLSKHQRGVLYSAEPQVIGNIMGRYSKNNQPNFGCTLQAFDGEVVTIDRRMNGPTLIERPLLSMGVGIQPYAFGSCLSNEAAIGSGFRHRFILICPPSLAGSRSIKSDPIPEHLRESYDGLIRAISELPRDKEVTIHISEEAQPKWDRTRDIVERLQGPGRRLSHDRAWAGKGVAKLSRIMLVLHVARHVSGGDIDKPVDIATVEATLAWARVILRHHETALGGRFSKPSTLSVATKIRRKIIGSGLTSITQREAQRAGGRGATAEETADALRLLADCQVIIPDSQQTPRPPGRPASPLWRVNPRLNASGDR